MMYNRLQSRARRMAMHGQPTDEQRVSGRTTGTALTAIGLAINTPGEWVTVGDHHGSVAATANLMDRMGELVRHLDLKFFEFDKPRNRLRCRIFTDNQWEIA